MKAAKQLSDTCEKCKTGQQEQERWQDKYCKIAKLEKTHIEYPRERAHHQIDQYKANTCCQRPHQDLAKGRDRGGVSQNFDLLLLPAVVIREQEQDRDRRDWERPAQIGAVAPHGKGRSVRSTHDCVV